MSAVSTIVRFPEPASMPAKPMNPLPALLIEPPLPVSVMSGLNMSELAVVPAVPVLPPV